MNNKISLPFWETVCRSFMYVLKNIPTIARISSIFLILWLICISMEINVIFSPDVTFAEIWKTEVLCATLTAIASTFVAVSLIRYMLLKQDVKWLHMSFGMNNIKFIGWNILFFLIVFLPSFFILAGAAFAENQGVPIALVTILGLASLIVLLIMLIFIGRLYLVYTASAINVKMSLQKAFALTQGNTLKIFFGILILILPTYILTSVLIKLYQLPNLTLTGACILSLMSMIVSFFDSCVKASYYTHLYQFFTYFDKEQKAKVTEKKEPVIVKSEPAVKTVTEPKVAPKKAAPKKKTVTKTKPAAKTIKALAKPATAKTKTVKKTAPKKTTTKAVKNKNINPS